MILRKMLVKPPTSCSLSLKIDDYEKGKFHGSKSYLLFKDNNNIVFIHPPQNQPNVPFLSNFYNSIRTSRKKYSIIKPSFYLQKFIKKTGLIWKYCVIYV